MRKATEVRNLAVTVRMLPGSHRHAHLADKDHETHRVGQESDHRRPAVTSIHAHNEGVAVHRGGHVMFYPWHQVLGLTAQEVEV